LVADLGGSPAELRAQAADRFELALVVAGEAHDQIGDAGVGIAL